MPSLPQPFAVTNCCREQRATQQGLKGKLGGNGGMGYTSLGIDIPCQRVTLKMIFLVLFQWWDMYMYIVTRYYILYLYYLLDTIAVFIYIYIFLCLYRYINTSDKCMYIHILFQRQVYLKIFFYIFQTGYLVINALLRSVMLVFSTHSQTPKKHYHRYYLDQGSSLSKIDCQFHMWWCGGLWLVI